jgi:prefoldin subunit 5
MPSDLIKEIDELKDQIQHFEAAITALEKPGQTHSCILVSRQA